MPRLNVYLTQDVYDLAQRWRETANLSEICSRAIQIELGAAEEERRLGGLLESLSCGSDLERLLAAKYGLKDFVIIDPPQDSSSLRDDLGRAAAKYLDRYICDGAQVAIAGGRQMWCMIRSLTPRNVRVTINSIGIYQGDSKLLHAHPNTLTTLMWLIYGPGSEAHIIEARHELRTLWPSELPVRPRPTYFVISSCSMFSEHNPFSDLIGHSSVRFLKEHKSIGDFSYIFFGLDGKLLQLPLASPNFIIPPAQLAELSRRADARVLLVAGGKDKLPILKATIQSGLCSSVITDAETATALLETANGMEESHVIPQEFTG